MLTLKSEFIEKRILKGLLKSKKTHEKDEVIIKTIRFDFGQGEKGMVFLSKNGSCRASTELLDCESILEELELDNYVYPHYSEKNFKIRKWQGGRHYYILENGNSIKLDDRIKWNTYQGAENALKDYLIELELQNSRNELKY